MYYICKEFTSGTVTKNINKDLFTSKPYHIRLKVRRFFIYNFKNMEIFRTDGGGKTYTDKRLFKVVSNIEKYINQHAFQNIDIINDHKGILIIHLRSLKHVDYIACVCLTFWAYELETEIVIMFKGKEMKSISL